VSNELLGRRKQNWLGHTLKSDDRTVKQVHVLQWTIVRSYELVGESDTYLFTYLPQE